MFNKKSGENRRTSSPLKQVGELGSPLMETYCSEPTGDGIRYYGLIEQTDHDYGYIGWVGDADAFVDRFGEVPPQACLVTPKAFGLKAVALGHLVALPGWLVWLMLSQECLPMKPLDDLAG